MRAAVTMRYRACADCVVIVLIAAATIAVPRTSAAQIAAPSGALPAAVPAVAQPCTGCHRPGGEGNPAAGVPRIAGQSQYYIAKQLLSYTHG
ncbi:MAG: c-type cytochrome, partial [Longimicrobiales bacterium]